MSAPCSIGLNKYGEGTVLSTINGMPCLCAILAIFGTSTTFAAGLPIDSQNIAFVFESINFSISSILSCAPNLTSTPKRGNW